MERLLAGADGSRDSLRALRWAADVATRTGWELVAARVFEPTQAELPPEQDAALRQEQLDELDGWCAALPVTGARPRTLLLDGAPPDALLAAAAAERAALLVVGG